ncbi:RelA/SpoT domain-containing protein [Corynebacterium kalidii]|uniref:RelA/SpoT domain-containing protein n=1 Tax=Corynebacterium kalidii TaxID=2931982 RepID=A0A9X1WJ21_9CORY|nr:RelA/SpoT domain-containing protein [Corynebacterium kalidii]MCJ7859476.1 RelA/SpoT domain-containing protein [Corynebacterium kalidii]
MTYTSPKYSKGEVRRAGKVLAGKEVQGISKPHASSVAANWRSSHAYPTWVIRSYLNTKLPFFIDEYLIASRTKKMPTIVSKLEEGIVSDLSSMQDIGGCRVVVGSIAEVRMVAEFLEKGATRTHAVKRKKDYLEKPKNSGYRGIHLISKYDSDRKPEYRGMQIETQVRTRLMHYWATTVEAVDLMSGSMLKRSHGNDNWKKFFVLVSDNIARAEGTERVLPQWSPSEVDRQIRALSSHLDVSGTLRGWSSVDYVRSHHDVEIVGNYFVVALSGSEARIFPYISSDDAENKYLELEADPDVNAVSVSAKDMEMVRSVYPNYFLDCQVFREYVEGI